jgi:hypothetical protein
MFAVTSNAGYIARQYGQVAERAMVQSPIYETEVTKILEAEEEQFFSRLNGRYVLSGATRASLTARGSGAIRRLHAGGFDFGSAVEQAGYITKAPKDPEGGQVPKPNRPDLRSAVLVLPVATEVKIADVITRWVAEAFR